MATQAAVRTNPVVLNQLQGVCARTGLEGLATRLAALSEIAGGDLAAVERELQGLPLNSTGVGRSAHHLLGLAGKRLRPLCVALAARAGSGFNAGARELAVAVELVHTATLLHDDVVDTGDLRRGRAAARVLYGNAASIFAGDWCLVEALRRVERSGVSGALPRLLAVIEEMIEAEALQLDNRGRLAADREMYLRIVEGKTAALFRWALDAGARAGGMTPEACAALEAFGLHLGTAFQVVDDVLDFAGLTPKVGKKLFADLKEGKMTLPLILALERQPALRPILEQVVALPPEDEVPALLAQRVVQILADTHSIEDARAYARDRVDQALEALNSLPPNPVVRVLAAVAESSLHRES